MILSEFDRQNRRLSGTINDYFRSIKLAREDYPTITHLVQETTRWRGYLDSLLSERYRGRFQKMEYRLRNILRLGAYEILFRSRVPRYAVVNESVTLARRAVNEKASGVANALLRTIQSTDYPRPEELRADDSPEKISRITSHPEWMIERWLQSFGFEKTRELCTWNNRPPSFSVRRNCLKVGQKDFERFLNRQNVRWTRKESLGEFYDVDKLARLGHTQEFESGYFSVQDMSGGLVVLLLDADEKSRILDVCAAPGGKSTYLAERLGNKGEICAYDVDEARLSLLVDNIQRLALDSIQISQGDAVLDKFPAGDRVLLDVPCSGTGVMAKRADLRWRRRKSHIQEMQSLQLRMLSHMSDFVKPGGLIVYATCSLEEEENWEVADLFLAQSEGFDVLRADGVVPDRYVDERGALHTYPPDHGLDGVFAVILERSG